MNLIITIMLLFIVLLVLVKVYDINTRKLKQFVEYEETKFNKLVEKYPGTGDSALYYCPPEFGRFYYVTVYSFSLSSSNNTIRTEYHMSSKSGGTVQEIYLASNWL